jgi:hypothetical protein
MEKRTWYKYIILCCWPALVAVPAEASPGATTRQPPGANQRTGR